MPQSQCYSTTISGFLADYERHLADFYGFAFNSRRLHLRVIRNFLDIRFPLGRINWHALQFTHLAEFLKKGVPAPAQCLDAKSLAGGHAKVRTPSRIRRTHSDRLGRRLAETGQLETRQSASISFPRRERSAMEGLHAQNAPPDP